MAEDAGIKNIYDVFYGHLSMYAHGYGLNFIISDLLEPVDIEGPIDAGLKLMFACLESVHLIVVNYIREKRQTKIEELEAIMKVKLSS